MNENVKRLTEKSGFSQLNVKIPFEMMARLKQFSAGSELAIQDVVCDCLFEYLTEQGFGFSYILDDE